MPIHCKRKSDAIFDGGVAGGGFGPADVRQTHDAALLTSEAGDGVAPATADAAADEDAGPSVPSAAQNVAVSGPAGLTRDAADSMISV